MTARPDCDLMWLGGYKAERHRVYFGTSRDPGFHKTFEGDANIFDPGTLKPGQTYYWRVDAIREGKTIEGETWGFTVRSAGIRPAPDHVE